MMLSARLGVALAVACAMNPAIAFGAMGLEPAQEVAAADEAAADEAAAD